MTNFVYLMGHGYSGSTLLTFLLNSHHDIATVGETGIAPRSRTRLDEFLCSCGERIALCPFWRRVAHEMAGRGFPFDVRDGSLLARSTAALSARLVAAELRPR